MRNDCPRLRWLVGILLEEVVVSCDREIGAFNLGLLDGLGVEQPLKVLLSSIPMNLYAIVAVLLAAFTVSRDFNLGPMVEAERRAATGPSLAVQQDAQILEDSAPPNAWNMLLPVACLVGAMPAFLLITGNH